MMRARPSPSGLIQASTYQYHLCSLLYNTRDPDINGLLDPYRCPNLHNLAAFFQRRINRSPHANAAVNDSWRHLARTEAAPLFPVPMGDAYEHACAPTIEWITAHGPTYGLRIPSVAERSRALGIETHLHTLGLSERDAYDAQGNAFDRNIVGVRCGAALQGWLGGQPLPPVHHYPTIPQLHALFRTTAAAVTAGWPNAHPELAQSPFLERGALGQTILDISAQITTENPQTLG